MRTYWSCSKFADWVRGTKKPVAMLWDQWAEWEKKAKEAHPNRYWLAEVALKALQNALYWPYEFLQTIYIYILVRFVDKRHTLQTKLKKGRWHDFDTRLLHGAFEALVDFVEIEIGGHEKPRRSMLRGLNHLKWEAKLKNDEDMGFEPGDKYYGEPTPQAEAAITVRDLYLWWKARPNRTSPHDLVKGLEGHDKYMEIDRIEEEYHEEDTKRLVELAENRRCIWS